MRVSLCAVAFAIAALPLAASAQPKPPPSSGTTAIIAGQGVVTRPADSATINLAIATSDDVADASTAKNNAVYDTLKTKLAPFGISGDKIKTTYYNLVFNPRPVATDARTVGGPVQYPYQPRYGYVVTRQVQVTVTDVATTGKAVDAAVAAGVTNITGVQYTLVERKAANDAALAAALDNAASQAAAVAAASHMRIVGIKQIQVGPSNNYPMPMPMRYPPGVAQPGTTELPPATVDVRASVTVTYILK
jgi:uncharacterized protein